MKAGPAKKSQEEAYTELKAAVKGNGRICEWLLSDGGLGPRHLAEDGDGNTPSLMARLEGHVELAEYLMASSEAALSVE